MRRATGHRGCLGPAGIRRAARAGAAGEDDGRRTKDDDGRPTIEFWCYGTGGADNPGGVFWEQVARDFEKANPGVRVTVVTERFVRNAHRPVRGRSERGRPYSANAPALAAWVHNVLTDSFLAAYRAYGPEPLSDAEADRFVRIALDASDPRKATAETVALPVRTRVESAGGRVEHRREGGLGSLVGREREACDVEDHSTYPSARSRDSTMLWSCCGSAPTSRSAPITVCSSSMARVP